MQCCESCKVVFEIKTLKKRENATCGEGPLSKDIFTFWNRLLITTVVAYLRLFIYLNLVR